MTKTPRRPRYLFLVARVMLLLAACALRARADLPRVTIAIGPPAAGGTEKCVKALAPLAQCMAVSEVGSVLVAGMAPPLPVAPAQPEPGALLVYSLDAAGAIVAGEPKRIPLPRPASLAAFKVMPTAVYAHPRLPVVYVWQDVMPAESAPSVPPPPDVVQRDFDHLLIYKVAGGTLELVKATARGQSFGYSLTYGVLVSDATEGAPPADAAADPDAQERLYLPNLQRPVPDSTPTTYSPLFGYVPLGAADGMPAEAEGALVIKSWPDPSNHGHIAHPMGAVPLSKRLVLLGGFTQVSSMELEGEGTSFSMPCDGSHYDYMTGHPTLPRIYATGLSTNYVYTFEHVDGAFTMLPQRGTVDSLAANSQPVIDVKSNRLLIGGSSGLHLIALDVEGLFTGTQQLLSVGHAVRAVAYSPKFDRIYVPVEKLE